RRLYGAPSKSRWQGIRNDDCRATYSASERDIVVQIRQVCCRSRVGCRRTRLGRALAALLLLGRRLVVVAAHCRFAAFAAAQHLHLVGHDVSAVAVLAGILVLPLAGFKAPFHVDRTAL